MKKIDKRDIQAFMLYLRSKMQAVFSLFLLFILALFSSLAYSKKLNKASIKKKGLAGIHSTIKVNKVSIKGNKLIDRAFIKSHIQLKEGSNYSDKQAQKDVRKLFSLGFFDDIQVHVHSSGKKGFLNVSYKFKERIPIAKVEFQGNDLMKTEDLKELSLIKEYGFLNWDELQKTLEAIREKYKEQGYYLTEVSYKTQKDPETNKFKLLINIEENKKLFIKKLSLIGNRSISSKELKAFMQTKEWNILSFLGSSGIFQPEAIERDRQFIEYYYRDKGYLNVRVKKPEINITPDKKYLYITFSISEGSRFKIGEALFQGDDIVSKESVKELLSLDKQEYFSLSRLQKDMQLIVNLYKDKGYAFAAVSPLFYPDQREENRIHIQFKVNPGDIYKVRRVRILGNHKARDKVILRRIRVREGDIYSESKKELSQQLIQQLGYFEEVKLRLSRADTKTKELDIIVNVKEREGLGEAQLAGGFSNNTLFIQGGFKKQNFLGLDQSIALNMIFNRYQETFTMSYQAPYFLDSRWNFAFDFFSVAQDNLSGLKSIGTYSINPLFSSRGYSPYFRLDTGFSVSFGRHITEYSTVFLKYKLKDQQLSYDSIYFFRELPGLSSIFKFLFGDEDSAKAGKKASDQESSEFSETIKKWDSLSYPKFKDVYDLTGGRGINSSLSLIWEYDKRNDRYYASDGFFTRLSAEYSGLGGDFDYTKLTGKFHHYYSPFWKLVVKNRFDYGLVFSNRKGKKPHFSELFLLGGPYNLRGFEINTQGPRRFSQEGLSYAHEYNRLLEKARSELAQKKSQLEDLTKQTLTEGNQAKIDKLEKEIIEYERVRASQSIAFPEAFAQRTYGGSQMFFYSLELEVPIIEQSGLRGAVFFDMGEVNDKLSFDLNDGLRMDLGIGIRWKSPFGPISLDLAFPYKPKKMFGEENMNFGFSFGSQF